MRMLVTVAVLKIALFLCLAGHRKVTPFLVSNTTDHYLPVAQRLIREGRFNGPDCRPDSKVPPGYPAFLALTLMVAP